MPEYKGLLFVGDPHVASRAPGFRKDNFPETILEKLRWCLDYADENHLLCCFLGDTFNFPRDNANWLLGDLCRLLVNRPPLVIFGNHDCRENALGDDDSLSVLIKAKLVCIVSETEYWQGDICGRNVIVGGTSWGAYLPERFWEKVPKGTLTFWMMHHDVRLPGFETVGAFDPYEIPGIDVVVNGHIHKRLDEAVHHHVDPWDLRSEEHT